MSLTLFDKEVYRMALIGLEQDTERLEVMKHRIHAALNGDAVQLTTEGFTGKKLLVGREVPIHVDPSAALRLASASDVAKVVAKAKRGKKKRVLSVAARKAISAAQSLRWEQYRKAKAKRK